MDNGPADNAFIQIAFSALRLVPQMRFAKAVSDKKRSSVCAFSHIGKPFLTSTFSMPGRSDHKRGTRVAVTFFSAAQPKPQTTIFAASD
jgi:hypothetical protein